MSKLMHDAKGMIEHLKQLPECPWTLDQIETLQRLIKACGGEK